MGKLTKINYKVKSIKLPDFHHTFQVIFGSDKLEKYDHWHLKFYYKKPMSIIPGIATQLVTAVLAILLIIGLFKV